jgi:hypothetical protein
MKGAPDCQTSLQISMNAVNSARLDAKTCPHRGWQFGNIEMLTPAFALPFDPIVAKQVRAQPQALVQAPAAVGPFVSKLFEGDAHAGLPRCLRRACLHPLGRST